MSAELQRAIVRTAKSDSTLNTAISSRIYYAEAQADTMPYVVFNVVGSTRMKTFDSDACWDDAMVQFSIYDDRKGVETVETIYDALVGAFDRTAMTFAGGKAQVGCQLESHTGPRWEEDCWVVTADFLIGVN